MKYLLMVCLFVVVGCGKNDKKEEPFDVKPGLPELVDRVVVLNAQGQTWAFNADQKVDVSILKSKHMSEDYVIATANLNAEATVKKDKPVTVKLSGVARLHYEFISGRWQLVNLENVNLRAFESKK